MHYILSAPHAFGPKLVQFYVFEVADSESDFDLNKNALIWEIL